MISISRKFLVLCEFSIRRQVEKEFADKADDAKNMVAEAKEKKKRDKQQKVLQKQMTRT